MMNPKYTKNLNIAQRVAHAVEECGELTAALGKSGRYGLDSFNPELPPEQRELNVEWVAREWLDLKSAMEALLHEYAQISGVDYNTQTNSNEGE